MLLLHLCKISHRQLVLMLFFCCLFAICFTYLFLYIFFSLLPKTMSIRKTFNDKNVGSFHLLYFLTAELKIQTERIPTMRIRCVYIDTERTRSTFITWKNETLAGCYCCYGSFFGTILFITSFILFFLFW